MIQKDFFPAILYFALSTLLTWWFVKISPLYISQEQMLLSTAVAGGKWAIQVFAGLVFLGEKRWAFVKEIGFVCLIGSCILIPYIALAAFSIANTPPFFVGSLVLAVVAMIFFYYKAISKLDLSSRWFLMWLLCLAIAVTLQLTVVF